jgi:hypothetical protein
LPVHADGLRRPQGVAHHTGCQRVRPAVDIDEGEQSPARFARCVDEPLGETDALG